MGKIIQLSRGNWGHELLYLWVFILRLQLSLTQWHEPLASADMTHGLTVHIVIQFCLFILNYSITRKKEKEKKTLKTCVQWLWEWTILVWFYLLRARYSHFIHYHIQLSFIFHSLFSEQLYQEHKSVWSHYQNGVKFLDMSNKEAIL